MRQPAIVAAAGLIAGIVAFVAARKRRDISANVAVNHGRQEERRLVNDAIRARNATRIAATILIVKPAAGVGR